MFDDDDKSLTDKWNEANNNLIPDWSNPFTAMVESNKEAMKDHCQRCGTEISSPGLCSLCSSNENN